MSVSEKRLPFFLLELGQVLRFRRDTDGAITGFLVDAGRIRGLGFVKRPSL
jgi:hypothetical protein